MGKGVLMVRKYCRVLVLCCWGVLGCSDSGVQKKLHSRWNYINDPARMDSQHLKKFSYKLKFSDLPLEGKLTNLPWSGDYWPTYKGGISYRWSNDQVDHRAQYSYPLINSHDLDQVDLGSLSPSEKFDLLLGRFDFPLTNYERKRTKILKTVEGHKAFKKGFEIPEWEGLCHAWAPATLAFREPAPVTLIGKTGLEIPFGSSDIKALLTYFFHMNDSKTYFLGSRCNSDLKKLKKDYKSGKISKSEYKKERRKCDDTNAGAFHVVLANQIALRDEGFIVDITRSAEVWNQAVLSYRSTIIREYKGASKGAAPGTVKEVVLETEMDYVDEVSHSWYPSSEDPYSRKVYHYRVEIDKDGYIVGGEWQTKDADRPDFLWKQETPEFSGYFHPLKNLYEKATTQAKQVASRSSSF